MWCEEIDKEYSHMKACYDGKRDEDSITKEHEAKIYDTVVWF